MWIRSYWYHILHHLLKFETDFLETVNFCITENCFWNQAKWHVYHCNSTSHSGAIKLWKLKKLLTSVLVSSFQQFRFRKLFTVSQHLRLLWYPNLLHIEKMLSIKTGTQLTIKKRWLTHSQRSFNLMYHSIPSLTIPPGDPRDSHILVAPGLLCLARGFARWS